MDPHRQPNEERAPTHRFCDATDGLAKRQFVWSHGRHRSFGETPVAERRCLEQPDDVVYRDGSNRAVMKPHEPEHRKAVEGAAEVIEHVIAAAVDHARLDDCPREARVADQLFGGPLGTVVLTGAVGSGPEEGHHDDASDAGCLCGVDHGPGAFDVDALVRLAADLTIDAGAMDDGLAALERLAECGGVGDVDAGPPTDDHHLVAIGSKPGGEVAADEPRPAGYCHSHRVLLRATIA